jgi:hypothetical protein
MELQPAEGHEDEGEECIHVTIPPKAQGPQIGDYGTEGTPLTE